LALYRTGQALAALAGRDYVIPDDVKMLAESALAHRLIIKTSSSMHDIDPRQVVAELLNTVPVEDGRGPSPDRKGGAAQRSQAGAARRGATGSLAQ
jgi:MoxR-like ATPase